MARWRSASTNPIARVSGRCSRSSACVAETLGVRRAGITLALHVLESKGLIRSARSQITICDREGLSEQANGSYGIAEAVYAHLFGNDVGASGRLG
jgi:hypothetical protein